MFEDLRAKHFVGTKLVVAVFVMILQYFNCIWAAMWLTLYMAWFHPVVVDVYDRIFGNDVAAAKKRKTKLAAGKF